MAKLMHQNPIVGMSSRHQAAAIRRVALVFHRAAPTEHRVAVLLIHKRILAEPLRQALLQIDRKMRGYARGDAVALGVESRTSSPVRMERDRETLEAVGLARLYPCGEGAGFAGGIMSAALDGIRVADAIARR